MFKNRSIKLKLIGAFLVTVGLVMVLSYFNVLAIGRIHNSFADIMDNHLPQLTTLQAMQVTATKIDKETTAYEGLTRGSQAEQRKNALLASLDKLGDQEKDYLVLVNRADTDERDEMLAGLKTISTARERTVNAIFELIVLKEQQAPASQIAAKETELAVAEATLQSTLTENIEQDLQIVRTENARADAEVGQIALAAVVTASAGSVFAVAVGLAISISIAHNIKKLKVSSARIAGGDFSSQIEISTNDELGELAKSFNQMSASLRASYSRLALEKERDEILLESMSEGMVALDAKGNIVLINSIAAGMLGFKSKQAVIGKKLAESVTFYGTNGKALEWPTLPSSITLQTAETNSQVLEYRTAGKQKVLLNVASSPVKLEGKVSGAILVLRDVTKEKEVDRMKTEFISLASHQLRTPLSAIKWFSEMLLNGDAGKLQPEQMDFTKNIADSTDRMVDLVNSLLNISRIESGRIIVDPHPTDLKELITGIVNDLKAKTEERQQTLIISVHPDMPKINLDPRLIGQVYLNLLTNAIKYTPKKGEISVFISKKGNDVISQVTDNGYGIPKAQQARIFQKFFRAENVAKVETDGTGLGLYLIKAIVESSGGKIWFESEENKGTSFWFTIPLSGMKPKEGEVTLDA